MTPLFTEEEFKKCKSRENLPLLCKHCNEMFYRTKHRIQGFLNQSHHGTGDYCSKKCLDESTIKVISVICTNCNCTFNRQIHRVKEKNFCSNTCSVTYNNTHKTTGIRRSKLEKYIEEQLTNLYPDLEIHFNRKDTIASELDIYIPKFKLAFELNGIMH